MWGSNTFSGERLDPILNTIIMQAVWNNRLLKPPPTISLSTPLKERGEYTCIKNIGPYSWHAHIFLKNHISWLGDCFENIEWSKALCKHTHWDMLFIFILLTYCKRQYLPLLGVELGIYRALVQQSCVLVIEWKGSLTTGGAEFARN